MVKEYDVGFIYRLLQTALFERTARYEIAVTFGVSAWNRQRPQYNSLVIIFDETTRLHRFLMVQELTFYALALEWFAQRPRESSVSQWASQRLLVGRRR